MSDGTGAIGKRSELPARKYPGADLIGELLGGSAPFSRQALEYDIWHERIAGFIKDFGLPNLLEPFALFQYLSACRIDIDDRNHSAARYELLNFLEPAAQNRIATRVKQVN